MDVRIRSAILAIVEGDITTQDTEAIVNAANSRLAGGGGVDGAIHKAGGPAIMAECRKIGGCPTGEAVITTGGNLKARHVIHAVGPVYRNGKSGEAALLRSAYLESLRLASLHGLKSVAFPSISTGAYGYPLDEAAEIAVGTARDYIEGQKKIELVRFVLFRQKAYEAFEKALKKIESS